MEPLFQTNTKYNFEEYQKFNSAVTMTINRVAVKIVMIDICFLLLGCIYMTKNLYATILLVLCAMIFPFIFYWTMKDSVKKTYQSNKAMQDLEVTFDFYQEFVSYHHKMGDNKIEYKDLYRLIETKTNFYLMIAKNQGLILKKENCQKELQEFLRGLKISKK